MKPLQPSLFFATLTASGLLLALASGCAIATSPRASATLTHPDGTVEVRESKGSAFIAWGDARATLDKLRVSNTTKTQSIGTSGTELETSATNVAPILGGAGELIGKAAKAFVAP